MKINNQFSPILGDDILNKYNFFQLYPFDGGGNFVNGDILGSADDEEIVKSIIEKGALNVFGGYENIDFHKFDCWANIERSSWINRLYFIVPLAKYAKLKDDKNIAETVIKIILDFGKNNWGPKTKEETIEYEEEVNSARKDYNAGTLKSDYINYQWYDFQPASRIVHIIYALYFLKSFLDKETENKINELIWHHAEVINWGEEDMRHLAPGNHQALRGMALLLACYYFADYPKEWLETSRKVIDYHILNDFLPDGMLLDISPSYHFFESWVMRDAKTLSERMGFDLSEMAMNRLEKAFNLCFALCQPDGFSTVVSDGYPLNMNVFLKTLETPKNELKDKIRLEHTGFAIYRKDSNYLLFDCSDVDLGDSHLHGGKQSVTLFLDGKPFLCDSACCNYDDPKFESYYKHPFAHSSLLVNGEGDSRIKGKYTWVNSCKCSLGDWKDNSAESTLISNMPQWKDVAWTRNIKMTQKSCEICDSVKSSSKKEFSYIFNLHFNVKCEKINDTVILLTNDNVKVKAQFSCPVSIKDALVCFDCKHMPAKQIICKTDMCNIKTVFSKDI